MSDHLDAIVIGGGFYGAAIAVHLAERAEFSGVMLIEKEKQLLARASYNNQARIHNGYHYPRSLTTAYRSRVNYPRFLHDWPNAVERGFTHYYAVARDSKVSAHQFERFCGEIRAEYTLAPKYVRNLFDAHLIEQVYAVEEAAFDATKLASWAESALAQSGVEVRLSTRVEAVRRSPGGYLLVDQGGETLETRFAINCTYSGLNRFAGAIPPTRTELKHEITELALIKAPEELLRVGVTVVDGPFFSMMPSPPHGLHTLSHVRYTPHCSWLDEPGADPYERLNTYPKESRVDRMLRDATRYLPLMRQSRYQSSLFEVKTVLRKSEGDDGRPILFEVCDRQPGLVSILGGKMDNIYDALERLDSELSVG